MSLFKYTVANKDGKKLSGSIEAVSALLARKELNNLGFSILEFSEIKEAPQEISKAGYEKFEFEAIDIHSKIVKGTIPAQNIDIAKKRLKTEYDLTILAIWQENASPEEIARAKEEGKKTLQSFLEEMSKEKINLDDTNKITQEFIKEKVDLVLKNVLDLLKKFDVDFDNDTKVEINKKIDKLLRIKNSKNIDYILSTAKDLLTFIESQSKQLDAKGFQDKKIELKLETSALLDDLKKNQVPKSLKADIFSKLSKWKINSELKNQNSIITKTLSKIIAKLYELFQTPPEIASLNLQISAYRKQRFELIKLLIKEPTKEYKIRVWNNIKQVNNRIKKTKEEISKIKYEIKSKEQKTETKDESLLTQIFTEINTLTGFILTAYLIYYFISFILTNSKFLEDLDIKGFALYENSLFNYMLAIIFLIHVGTSTKINLFRTSKIASITIPIFTIILILITILNF